MNYLIGFVVCALITYYAVKQMDAYAVTVVVLWGAFLAKPVVEAVIWVYGYFRDAPLKPYQGQYYAFDYHQVRFIEIGRDLWVVDADILPLFGLAPTEAARRQALSSEYRYLELEKVWVYSEKEILRILKNSQHVNVRRLLLWLDREVYKPHRNKAPV